MRLPSTKSSNFRPVNVSLLIPSYDNSQPVTITRDEAQGLGLRETLAMMDNEIIISNGREAGGGSQEAGS